jgi:Tuberculosis necrotizing toxin
MTPPSSTKMSGNTLPPGAEDGAYSVFRVVEPLTVQAGQVAPAFGSFGGGTQYLLPKSVKELLESGVIERVTP